MASDLLEVGFIGPHDMIAVAAGVALAPVVRPGDPTHGSDAYIEVPGPSSAPLIWKRPDRLIITRREAAQRARELIRAKTVPDTLQHADPKVTLERIVSAMRAGADLGMPPQTALDSIQLWGAPGKERYCIRAEGGLALALGSGLVTSIRSALNGVEIDDAGDDSSIDLLAEFPDATSYEIRVWRRGQFDPYVGKFTVRDARRAKLWNNSRYPWWLQYPARMLKWRATAIALHDGFADVLGGLSIMEEMRDVSAAAPPVESDETDYLADA